MNDTAFVEDGDVETFLPEEQCVVFTLVKPTSSAFNVIHTNTSLFWLY